MLGKLRGLLQSMVRNVATSESPTAGPPEIGRDIKWIDVINQVFRVLEFDRTGTTIGSGDSVKATTRFKAYGYLLVESPIFSQPVRLPIVHRDDFILAVTVFDEPQLVDLVTEEELLVTYVPKQHLSNRSGARIFPRPPLCNCASRDARPLL